MNKPHDPLPYFDALLSLLDDNPLLAQAFGRHVHWGYWETPPPRHPDAADFAQAAENLTRAVCAAANIGAGQQILDVGCGFGGTVASLNERFGDVNAYGLNIEHRQLLRAQRLVLPAPGNELDWINADACALPFADQSFDAVLAVECIFHFPDRRTFFREAFRVLKPGGRLALSDFLASRWLAPAIWLKLRLSNSGGFYGNCDVRFNFQHYRELALETGFKLVVERDITRNTLPTYDFLGELTRHDKAAAFETRLLEYTSRIGLLRYGVLGFEKPV
jgi:ubiquinone/menaquinone biosynthesis C-methylase UbiE